jgi:hypothetical protein
MLPAIIATAIGRARGVDGAAPVAAKKLAGLIAGFDPLSPGSCDMDDVLRFEVARREAEKPGKTPNVTWGHFHIPGHSTAKCRASQAIEGMGIGHGEYLIMVPVKIASRK